MKLGIILQAANMVARYRGGGGAGSGLITGGESSIDSLDDDDEEEEDESSSARRSQSSYGTRESVAAAGGTETLPMGGTGIITDGNIVGQRTVSTTVNDNQQQKTFQWTLSNWGAAQAARRRNNSGTVRVDLASPEDISLDTDNSSKVVFSAYGTTV